MTRVSMWGPAPNRHLEPMLDALRSAGALDRVYYAGDTLGWTQLGTAPARRRDEITLPRSGVRRAVREAIAGSSASHLMVSFANRLCFEAMARCARERVPYFVLAESFTPRPRSVRGWVRDSVYRFLLRNVAGVFALSPACAEDFLRVGVPRERIHPGIYPGPAHRGCGGASDPARIVFCGRMVALKGVDLLARAALLLADGSRRVRLELVGAGPELPEIRRALRGSAVELVEHGAVSSERVLEILDGAGALVLPTRFWEGWGYVVNEAIAAGVPVVASDIVAARELLVDGRNGAVFRSEDAASLADAIARALALHAAPQQLGRALDVTRHGMDASAFAAYLLAVMDASVSGSPIDVQPPWHRAAEDLGGNPEARWWQAWAGTRGRSSRTSSAA